MPPPNTPTEIARETFRQLIARKVSPTPDNYLKVYHQIAGTRPPTPESFPEGMLRTLGRDLPRSTPGELRQARELDKAIDARDEAATLRVLKNLLAPGGDEKQQAWGEIISDLLLQWDARQTGLTQARKRESLDHVLKANASNSEQLHARLSGLLKSWTQLGEKSDIDLVDTIDDAPGDESAPRQSLQDRPATVEQPGTAAALLPELRELFAFTLETAVATQLVESRELSEESRALAARIRQATTLKALEQLLADLKRFAYRMELLADDQLELRTALLDLLKLVIENISELVVEDHWLHGQVEIVRDIIANPLSLRSIDDAERHLKEVIFKQSQLKTSLNEAKEALKSMLAGFVDHLAVFSDSTSEYHDKIGACAERISKANDITELEEVLKEVMHETRVIQLNAQRSRDELQTTRQRVADAEQRITTLQNELDEASRMVRHDQLTGALNRRGLEEAFAKESARCLRRRTPLCVALLDIDNFKKLNDSAGHDAGDAALVHLARVTKETLRPQDTVARFGGEEFVILLPDTDLEAATQALTRLQRELTKKFFLHDNERILITFSAGVTPLHEDDTQETVTKRADAAMYEAKKTGKNRVIAVP